jgi:hypothetical protein
VAIVLVMGLNSVFWGAIGDVVRRGEELRWERREVLRW